MTRQDSIPTLSAPEPRPVPTLADEITQLSAIEDLAQRRNQARDLVTAHGPSWSEQETQEWVEALAAAPIRLAKTEARRLISSAIKREPNQGPKLHIVADNDIVDDEIIHTHPPYRVNVGGTYHYSTSGELGRALYERKRGGENAYWLHRGSLPHVHARIVRRDGSWARNSTEYLISAGQDGERVLVDNADLEKGRWADRLGFPLSFDRNIRTAVATAIAQIAEDVAEVEATPRPDACTGDDGRVMLPPVECLPDGYLRPPTQATPETIREGWGNVAIVAGRSPRLALTLGASAGAPFLAPLHRQSYVWDLYGEPRQGKTTAEQVAAAVWGDPTVGTGVVLSWNSSKIGGGRHLGHLGILPAFFDERGLSEWTPARWGEHIYSLTQGSSRLTAEREGHGTRRSPPWFGVLFSSGNGRLTEGIDMGRFAGVPARVIELPAPFTLNAEEADWLTKDILPTCYGWLGRAILERFSLDDVRTHLAAAAQTVGIPTGGVPRTIAEHLHLAVAGAAMVDSVMGTDRLVFDAAVAGARTYLEDNAHTPKHDADRLLDTLLESLAVRRSAWPTEAQYVEMGKVRPGLANGGVDRSEVPLHGVDQSSAGAYSGCGQWLYVFGGTWNALVADAGVDPSVTCKELHRRGVLHVADSRRRHGEWQSQVRIGGKQARVYKLQRTDVDGVGGDDADTQPPLVIKDLTPQAIDVDMREATNTDAGESPRTAAEQGSLNITPSGSVKNGAYDPVTTTAQTADRRRDRQQHRLTEDKTRLDVGQPLRLLHALENEYLPLRRIEGTIRKPYLRPRMPDEVYKPRPMSGYTWSRPYDGPVVSLDRNGAYVAAASSVTVAHGPLVRTGGGPYKGRPGVYLMPVCPWYDGDRLPCPLPEANGADAVWVPHPVVDRLCELAKAGRWADAEPLDSYTADPVRLTGWAHHIDELRAHTITHHGRDSDAYSEVKVNFGQALSLMYGRQTDDGGREWMCAIQRPDWPLAIYSQSAVTLHRWADSCWQVVPKAGPVALRNTDELVLPTETLKVVTTAPRPGGLQPLRIDPDGITLGTFKVKGRS